MNIFQKVTFKTLLENKTRTIVTIIGILLSLSMFTAVTTSISSFQNYMLEYTIEQEGNWHGNVSVTAADMEVLNADPDIDTVSYLEYIGYARIEGCTNPDKPYLFLGGMDENAYGTLPITITEGRLPENENEILLPRHLDYNGGVSYSLNDILTLEIGDRITTGEAGTVYTLDQKDPYLYTKDELLAQGVTEGAPALQESESLAVRTTHTYTVVGFYNRPAIEPYTAPGYTALTISGQYGTGSYTAYIRFEKPGNAIPWLREHYPDSYNTNYDLLRMYGASYERSYNTVLYGLGTILIFIILFGSISLIYNAFSISVTERTKQFGLLSSLGATQKQLTHSVLFEAFCLCIIGIPLGVLAGIAGIGITFALIGPSLSAVLYENSTVTFGLHVTPWAIVIAAGIGLFTVLLSAYLPARRAAKRSPIEAIRMTADVRIRPGKVKTSRLTYRLFGLPGTLAAKNFKRSRKKYRATVLSLFVSVVLFISASSFCSYLMEGSEGILSDAGADIAVHQEVNDSEYTVEELLNKLASSSHVVKAAAVQSAYVPLLFNRRDLNPEYTEYLEVQSVIPRNQKELLLDTRICFINDSSYTEYLQELGLSKDVYMNAAQPTALAFDFTRVYEGESGRYNIMHALANDNMDFTILKDAPFFLGSSYASGLTLFYPASAMEAVMGNDANDHMMGLTTYYFTTDDYRQAEADLFQILSAPEFQDASLTNYAENVASERTLLMIIMVFSYGFIVLISLIAMANVFNTISTNIQLRKREFAMLKSTGLEPKGFRVMMCYECLLYGIKGLLYGIPASALITLWIYRTVSDGWTSGYYIPWQSLVIAIGSVFLTVGATMIYSMHKLGRENIMDNLKNENA